MLIPGWDNHHHQQVCEGLLVPCTEVSVERSIAFLHRHFRATQLASTLNNISINSRYVRYILLGIGCNIAEYEFVTVCNAFQKLFMDHGRFSSLSLP